MIDPFDVTRYDRTDSELEEFWLFTIVVAGKTATTQAKALDRFLVSLPTPKSIDTPLRRILAACLEGTLMQHIVESRLGQYNRIYTCFRSSIGLDLRTCTVDDLEHISGIGPKTARFFLLHSRPNQRLAVLDTHLLKYLAAQGIGDTPKSTPAKGAKYDFYEQKFLDLADKSGMSVAEFDLHVWSTYARGSSEAVGSVS